MEKLLREFYAEERELDREVDPEILRTIIVRHEPAKRTREPPFHTRSYSRQRG